jgi:hypothetical protein
MSRYNLRYGTTRVPMVEVLEPEVRTEHVLHRPVRVGSDRVVKRVYGFTPHHAYRRALRWVRQNGDPR